MSDWEAGRCSEGARDVRLIMGQINFLQKNVDEALWMYECLTENDHGDSRPYFCRGMIYSLLDKNDESKVQFVKYRELSPMKFEVVGYLRSSLSRIKVFGTYKWELKMIIMVTMRSFWQLELNRDWWFFIQLHHKLILSCNVRKRLIYFLSFWYWDRKEDDIYCSFICEEFF